MAWWLDSEGNMVHSSAFSTPTPWERLETSLKNGLDKSPESEELLEIKVCFGEIKAQFVRLQEERQKKGRHPQSTVVGAPKVAQTNVDVNGTQWGGFGSGTPIMGDPKAHEAFNVKPPPRTHHAINLEKRYEDLEFCYQNLDREFRKCSDAVIDINARIRSLEGYEMPDRLRRMEACVGRLELNNVKDDPTVEYVE